jgi:hypothetical protein
VSSPQIFQEIDSNCGRPEQQSMIINTGLQPGASGVFRDLNRFNGLQIISKPLKQLGFSASNTPASRPVLMRIAMLLL